MCWRKARSLDLRSASQLLPSVINTSDRISLSFFLYPSSSTQVSPPLCYHSSLHSLLLLFPPPLRSQIEKLVEECGDWFWQHRSVVLGMVVLSGWGRGLWGGVGGVMRTLWLTVRRRSRDAVMTESWAERWSLSWKAKKLKHVNTNWWEDFSVKPLRSYTLLTMLCSARAD